jgi:AraC family transcriptional regulator, regulatory protein of adaptative response / methylated-DNA-[protein]-cysteine methyltransferase
MPLDEASCWKAVENRDATHDGKFVFGVLTTGVYCRPSCAARRPLRRNVRFFTTPVEAEAAGLRACLRCRPLATIGRDPLAAKVEKICRYIEAHATEPLPLGALAVKAGVSPFHLQRSFKAIVGVSPKVFQENARIKALKDGLRSGGKVTDAIYDAGYGSASRVYEKLDGRLGMTPRQYRRGGEGVEISYAFSQSPLGLLLLGATDRGVCFVQFGTSEAQLLPLLEREFPAASLAPAGTAASAQFSAWMSALERHLASGRPHPDLAVDLHGTAFQLRVWRYLQSIPAGDVQSYAEVARGIGAPRAVRAVAQACAANRVAVFVPCHRVIRGTGELGGYRWGSDRKRALLDAERGARAAK